ncbi:histone-lysine N-methyltransferase ATX2-like protein isoform X1 [Tanacetum coccineum]
MKCIRLTCDLHCSETDDLDVNKMIFLLANLMNVSRIDPGKSTVGTDLEGDGKKDEGSGDSKKTCLSTELVETKFKGTKSGPFIVGDLEVLKLGKMGKDLNCVNDEGSIGPLGADPLACWNIIYKKIRQMHSSISDNSHAEAASESFFKSGADMFGFSDPHVLRLIQGGSNSKLTSKSTRHMPAGYRPIHVKWKDLDKCNLCHMDEEYANNMFLQCDKCRMMVHARCYGELEPVDGVLWLCNLCRPGAPEVSSPYCLCLVTRGAMKPTTDGRWAHLACAMWIPGKSIKNCNYGYGPENDESNYCTKNDELMMGAME